MFLLNEILVFTPGRRQEGLDRLAWIHGLMAPHAGFWKAVVARYLGDGTTHTVLRMWDDEAAFQRFREGPDGNYGKGRPEGLYVNRQVIPRWENVLAPKLMSSGPFLVKVQFETPETAWDGFLQQAQQLQAAVADVSAGQMSVYRSQDRTAALVLARYPDRAAFDRLLESSAFGDALPLLPEGVVPAAMECFEIVSEVGPA